MRDTKGYGELEKFCGIKVKEMAAFVSEMRDRLFGISVDISTICDSDKQKIKLILRMKIKAVLKDETVAAKGQEQCREEQGGSAFWIHLRRNHNIPCFMDDFIISSVTVCMFVFDSVCTLSVTSLLLHCDGPEQTSVTEDMSAGCLQEHSLLQTDEHVFQFKADLSHDSPYTGAITIAWGLSDLSVSHYCMERLINNAHTSELYTTHSWSDTSQLVHQHTYNITVSAATHRRLIFMLFHTHIVH
ncbi:hypothetical protein JOB18_001400 [Solea senegalensis]|uniref:Uncharacterized protein n=1 Tax=Solea senegalensis TaxID=28829 RepID=A0AAV6SPN2_SOLSE|nr:hypothetical protein JOB18_001400 [Solea senegalensis]